MLKLNRLAPSTATGGMVCATTPSSNNGTETSVQVIFPQGFVLSTSLSNWTVDTGNLPNGAVAWPGIATATNVSGYTITFPSDDLSPNTQYCFNFSSTNTLMTPGQTGNFPGTIRTRDGSNNIIDIRDYGVAIVQSDQIAITATVPANPTDFLANLALTSPANGTFQEGTTLTYTLTYGSLLTTSTNITVETQWDLGTVQGSVIPTENTLTYVVGSATSAYNSTPSVIDTTNRKIDWVIPTIPGNTTSQTVSFQLQTTSSYKGSLPVSFSVNGRVLGPGTVTPDSTVTSTYKHSSYITPTPTPTCAPSTCPTSTPQPTSSILTPTPTGTQTNVVPKISDIQIRTVNSSEASIYIDSNKNTSARIDYGTSLNNLNKTLYDTVPTKQHLINLKDLKSNTRYYFKVTIIDNSNQKAVSDFYSLDTALKSASPKAITGSLIVTSGDVVLVDPLSENGSAPGIIIPQNTSYSFKFEVKDPSSIKLIRAIERNNNVLGIESNDSEPGNTGSISVIEISPGHYIGKLLSNTYTGNYRLFLQLQDYYGNLNEQKIADLYIVQPLKVVDKNNGQGIEDAKVIFYVLNQRLRTYGLVASVTPIKNPNNSEPDGNVWTVLPEGQYRAEISALGYNSKTVDFSINANSKSFYPTVGLIRQPFNLLTNTTYYAKTAMDVVTLLRSFVHNLRLSFRFFDLTAFVLITFLVFVLTIATSKRLSVPIFSLPYFAYYHLIILFRKPDHNFIVHGRVSILDSDEPVPGAMVYISYPGGKVISHTITNLYGEFFAKIHDDTNIKVIVSKKGYKSYVLHQTKGQYDKRMDLKIIQKPNTGNFYISNVRWYTEYLLGALLESFLFVSIGMEVLFSLEFGIIKVLPFIVMSSANLIIWAANMRAQRVNN